MYVYAYLKLYVCMCIDLRVIFLLSAPIGSIPPQIGNLTLLRELILLNNDLTGGDSLAEVSVFVIVLI